LEDPDAGLQRQPGTGQIDEKRRVTNSIQQAQIVDPLRRQCPGFAVMRKLVFSFRAILRGGQSDTPDAGWKRRAR
jgi:hypothetical protein